MLSYAARYRLAVALVVLGWLAAAVGIGSVAWATHWNYDDTYFKVGGENVRFDLCALENNTHNAWHNNNNHDIAPTNITVSHFHTCQTIDVMINDYAFGHDNARGKYHCHDHHSSQNYNHAHAHLNTTKDTIPENYNVTLHTVCHEIAHGVGLGHSLEDDSCVAIEAVSERHLTPHDKDEINDNYP